MKLHVLALIAGLVMTGSSYAVTLDHEYTGDISGVINNTSSFGAGITYFDTFSVDTSGTIDHSLSFNINTNLYAGSGVSDLPISLSFGSFTLEVLNISGLSAEIRDSGDNLYASFISNGDLDHLTLPTGSYFATGNYTLKIGGTVTGNSGGTYTVAAVTVAVPEPETYAMLLVGLGLVGYRLRQKNRAAGQTSLN
jgi:hypothetical protein